MNKAEAKQRIAKLRQEINRYRYQYHVLDKSDISEAALDSLKHELVQLEKQYPDLITPDSPSQRVAGTALPGFSKVRHRYPILSIEDAFNMAEVVEWQERNAKILGAPVDSYFGELKMDGLAMVLTYEQGLLVQAATRGDGRVGEDVTINLRTVESVPLRLENLPGRRLPSRLDVRGEVVITKREWQRINAEQVRQNLPLFANPRNLAAGTIRQLQPQIAASRRLEFYAFELMTDINQLTHEEVHFLLRQLGFKTNPHCRLLANLTAVEEYLNYWQDKRQQLPYQTDGVVLVVNNIAQEKKLGSVGKADRWMLAYKFPAEQATTKVEDIMVQVGRTGVLTPVAKLTPVRLAGTTVSRATLHNYDEVKRLDIRVGDTVIVQKAGDIIPDVVQVLSKLRNGREKIFVMPKLCPSCGSAVIQPEGEVAYYCSNRHCPAVRREGLYHAVGKNGLDIPGLGPRIVDQLWSAGLIKDLADLFILRVDDLEQLPGFGRISAAKLIKAIDSRRRLPLDKLLVALGIRHIGQTISRDLAVYAGSLTRLLSLTAADLSSVPGVGSVAADSLVNSLRQPAIQKLLKKLLANGLKIEPIAASATGPWQGKKVVFTGSLTSLARSEAQALARQLGAEVGDNVSSQTDYVVVGDKPGSKYDRAKKLSIKIINEEEFLKLAGKK